MKRKTNTVNGNKPLNDNDLRPTVRLLVVLALLKLTVVIGLAIIVTQQGDTIEQQGKQLDAQGAAVTRVDQYVKSLQSADATRAQQIVLYKIFLAQCEGRSINGTLERTGDKTVEDCAKRLFLAQPLLPTASVDVVVPSANSSQ